MIGKAVFLLIASAMIGATALMFEGKQSAFDTQSEQSEYQANAIARDIALSGYDEILSTVKREKMSAVGEKSDVSMLGGSYDQTVTENIYGDLDIRVDGDFSGIEHTVKGNVIFASPFPGAIALSDDEVDADAIGLSYSVSGVDERAPSRGAGSGFLRPVAGVVTDEIHLYDVTNGFDASRVWGEGNEDGSGGSPSVASGFDKTFYEAIYQEALTRPYTYVEEIDAPGSSQSQIQGVANSSGPDNPKIIRAQGGLMINYPVDGHGLIIVEDGDFKVISNDFNWEGLVLVRKQNTDTVAIDLNLGAEIHGALVGYSVPGGGDEGDCAGDFEIDGDEVVTRDSVSLKFTVLGAAISAGGSYDMPVTVRIRLDGQSYYPFGNWSYALSGNVNTGNSGETHVWEPSGIYPPDTRIRIGARSWIKKQSYYSGNSNSHWKVYMEEDNLSVDEQLAVLEDGSPVPNVGGYLGQYSVEDFVSDYIDSASNEMTLEESDAIYLYELGSTNPASEAHDMQDLVMLVTMTKADGTSGCQGGIAGVNRIEFSMSGTSKVRYSAEALAKLGKTLDTIASTTRVVVTQDETFTDYQEGQYGSTGTNHE